MQCGRLSMNFLCQEMLPDVEFRRSKVLHLSFSKWRDNLTLKCFLVAGLYRDYFKQLQNVD